MANVTASGVEAGIETALEGVMKVEPTIATIVSMFVPGAAPIVAIVQPEVMLAAPFVENALKALAAGNNGDLMTSFIQLLQHLMPGQPNASTLGTPTSFPKPDMPPAPSGS
jgi:hypothetical protein